METTRDLVERLRAQMGGVSTYRLGKHLQVSDPTILRYVRGGGSMAPKIAMRVADELGLSREYVLLCLAREREQDEDIKPMWERLGDQVLASAGKTASPPATRRRASKVAGVLLVTGIAALSALTPSPARAAERTGSVYYGKSRIQRFRPRIGRPRRIRRRRPLQLPAVAPITAA